MKKYFYACGEQQCGPYSFEELKDKNITAETLIWYEGLENWTAAKNINEFQEILELTPPPIVSEIPTTKQIEPPPTAMPTMVSEMSETILNPSPDIPANTANDNTIEKPVWKKLLWHFAIMSCLNIVVYLKFHTGYLGESFRYISAYLVGTMVAVAIIHPLIYFGITAIPTIIVYVVKRKFWKGFFTLAWILYISITLISYYGLYRYEEDKKMENFFEK